MSMPAMKLAEGCFEKSVRGAVVDLVMAAGGLVDEPGDNYFACAPTLPPAPFIHQHFANATRATVGGALAGDLIYNEGEEVAWLRQRRNRA